MNYQRRPRTTASQAAELLSKAFPPDEFRPEFQEAELLYYAWPEVFGSTAGPFGGIGGASITTFTMEAWACGRFAVLFCAERVIRCVDDFRPLMRVGR